MYTTNLRLDIRLPAPGEEDLSTFEEDFDIVVVPNVLKNKNHSFIMSSHLSTHLSEIMCNEDEVLVRNR